MLATLLLTVGLAEPQPRLLFVSPTDGSRVSGALTLRVELRPAGTPVTRLTLSANGQRVCTLDRPPFECPWDAGSGNRAHLLRATAQLADGTRLSSSVRTRTRPLVFSADAGVVQVMATVTDRHGQFVKGLPRGAFRVLEDGRPQAVVHFDDPSAPRELVAALDMSASMMPAMTRLRAAVKTFLGRVRPIDKLTLLAFNDAVFSLARREVDPAARDRAVDRLAAWGGTALYDTLLQGLDLAGRQRGRKALVVFSDGEDTASLSTAEDVERRVRSSDAPLYVIAQGRGQEVAALRELVGRLARLSGGRAFYTNDIDELGAAFDQIAEELDAQYSLTYAPDNTARDGTWRSIKVELPGLTHSVRAREGYRAEASQP